MNRWSFQVGFSPLGPGYLGSLPSDLIHKFLILVVNVLQALLNSFTTEADII